MLSVHKDGITCTTEKLNVAVLGGKTKNSNIFFKRYDYRAPANFLLSAFVAEIERDLEKQQHLAGSCIPSPGRMLLKTQ